MNKQDIKLEDIADVVCNYYKITRPQFEGQRRYRFLAEARQMYCYIAKKEIESSSLRIIGKRIGNKDHSTVIHSIKKIDNFLTFDKKIQREYNEIMEIINAKKIDPIDAILEYIRYALPMDTDLALEIERKVLEFKQVSSDGMST